jgi:hypothetical protein
MMAIHHPTRVMRAFKAGTVGFHLAQGEGKPDCGKRVSRYDSSSLSWLECECGARGLDHQFVTYGAPVQQASPISGL